MRSCLLLLLVPSVALAQPAPAGGFDPIGPDGWPRGLSLPDLRALPECGAEGLSHTPGAPVTCRPPIVTHGPQWGMGVDWTSGGVFGDAPTLGIAHALGVEADFALAGALQLAARYELLGVGISANTSAVSNQFLGLARVRLFTDEVTRSAWSLGVGGGYALRGMELGGSAPLVRASLEREVGLYIDDANAMTAAVELAYEQSLGDARLSAILASVRLGFETQIRAPANLGRPAPSPWRHTTSFDVLVSPFLGVGMSVGLRANPMWSLETSGDFLFDFTSDSKVHGFDNASWSLASGPRIQLGIPEFAPLYLQVQGGAAWIAHVPSAELHGIVVGELGLRGLVGCGNGFDLGAWLRDDLATGGITSGGLVLRMVIGSGPSAAGGQRADVCTRVVTPQLAMPPPPVPTPTRPEGHSYTVELNPPNVHVPTVQVDANVTVPAPQPIVIEVDLGAQLGGFDVRLDPRLVPIDRLRGAGWLEVELSGPPDALATFQGQLSATLSRGQVRVDGWASVPSSSSVVHARFTVWPPGTRPAR